MRELDRTAIEDMGIPGIVLMENAGLRVVEVIEKYFDHQVAGKRIAVFAGKGNNGGDGLVIARHLVNKKARVKVYLLADPEAFTGDAATNMAIISKMNVPIYRLQEESSLTRMQIALKCADMVVDAIFGTGFRGSPRGIAGQVIKEINAAGVPVLSVDIPSGLEADTGKVKGECIKADITVTFGLPKLGLLVEPGASVTGKLVVGDISIPESVIDRAGLNMEMLTCDWCRQQLPKRQATGHKGTYGHVLVIGGSNGMTGAPVLAAQAALKSGAGLVTVAVPRSLQHLVAAQVPEALTKGLPETENEVFSQEALDDLLSLISKATAVVIGPGISREETVKSLLAAMLPKVYKPAVIDADALTLIAELNDVTLPRNVVLTPHPGEMARLLHCSTGQVQGDRLAAVRQAAEKYRATTILKGARSLIATPEGDLYINTTGNPGMATGGSGDVLAGMVGALLAQGLTLDKASAAAAFIHGWAGDEAVKETGEMGLVAGDLVRYIPKVLHTLGR